MSSAIYVIQLETAIRLPPTPDLPPILGDNSVFIPQTKQAEPELKQEEPKREVPEFEELFEKVKDDEPEFTTELKTSAAVQTSDEIEQVDVEMELEIPTLDLVSVQQVATPKECEDLLANEERMECLNAWIDRYIKSHAKYPALARQFGNEDKVWVLFVIDENGNIEKTELLAGDYEELNEEALRVVKSMPQFAPAKHQWRKAKMRMRVPVSFKLR